MKLLSKLLLIGALSFIGGFAVAGLSVSPTVHAQDEEQQVTNDESQDTNQESQTSGEYSFTAQPGDSYSLIARKSVQIYGIETGTDLSQAKIIAAETWLTKDAGSPELNQGESVTVQKSAVEAAVNRAKALSESVEALWAPYATYANFNTDNVGEAR